MSQEHDQDRPTAEQLAYQLADNMTSLIQADLKLKAIQQEESTSFNQTNLELRAAQQRGDVLLQQFQAQMDVSRRFERRVLLGIFAIAIIAGGILHLLFPDFLPEQIDSISSFFRHL